MPDDKKPIDNEGEGSKTADAAYRRHVGEFIEEEDVEELARQAQRDVEADEPAYRLAEEQGKSRAAEEDPELDRKA